MSVVDLSTEKSIGLPFWDLSLYCSLISEYSILSRYHSYAFIGLNMV